MIYRISLAISFSMLFLLIPFKQVESATSLGAHEHGSATLNIAVDGDSLFLEFDSPAVNIVGFEHAAKTSQQTTAIKQSIEKLQNFDEVLQLSDNAHCRLISVSADLVSERGVDSTTDGHTEFHAEYHLDCKNIDQLDYIDVKLLLLFPAIENLDVQAILSDRQTAAELNAKNHQLSLQ